MKESIGAQCDRYRAERDCARQETRRALQDYGNARVELCAALGIDTETGWSDAMAEVGAAMSRDLRETGIGGLAGTPTGQAIRDIVTMAEEE